MSVSSVERADPLVSPFIRGLVRSLTTEGSSWRAKPTTGTSFAWQIEHVSTEVCVAGTADSGVVSTVVVVPPRGFPYVSLTVDERLLLMQTLLGLPTAPGQLAKAQAEVREKDAKDRAAEKLFTDAGLQEKATIGPNAA